MPGHVDALLAFQQRARAEGTRALASPGLRFDPALPQHVAKVMAQPWISGGEGLLHGGARLVPGERLLFRCCHLRRLQIKVMQGRGALQPRRRAQRPARQFDVRVDRLQHGIERSAAHRPVEQRRVEKVRNAAPGVQTQTRAGDAVERRRQRVRMVRPGLLPGMKRRLAQPPVRLRHQRPPTRHRHRFRVPVGEGHVEGHLAAQRVVEPSPGMQPVHVQVRRQRLHRRRHLMRALLTHAPHRVLRIL